jgi:hypothetical protein
VPVPKHCLQQTAAIYSNPILQRHVTKLEKPTVNFRIHFIYRISSLKRVEFIHVDLPSSGMLRNIYWQLLTDVSGQRIGTTFYCLTLEYGTDRLFRNVSNDYQRMLHNMPEEPRSHLHRGGSLKSRTHTRSLRFRKLRFPK